jgi:hypothetical protein
MSENTTQPIKYPMMPEYNVYEEKPSTDIEFPSFYHCYVSESNTPPSNFLPEAWTRITKEEPEGEFTFGEVSLFYVEEDDIGFYLAIIPLIPM